MTPPDITPYIHTGQGCLKHCQQNIDKLSTIIHALDLKWNIYDINNLEQND